MHLYLVYIIGLIQNSLVGIRSGSLHRNLLAAILLGNWKDYLWEECLNTTRARKCHFYPRPVLAFGYCHRLRLWVCVCVNQSRACPDDNSSPIQARIAKFGPEMQNTLVWVPIVLGDDLPRSSRSNLTWKSNFTPFWACSHHYSSAIQARITKFGPKMHLSTVKIPTNFWLDWFWSSLSFSILKPIFLPNLFAPFLYIFSETRRL